MRTYDLHPVAEVHVHRLDVCVVVQRILAELAPDAALLEAYGAEQLVRGMTGKV